MVDLPQRPLNSQSPVQQSTIVNRSHSAAHNPRKSVKSVKSVVSLPTAMKTPSRRHAAAFTLIELMAVITIIVILAGLVVGGMGYVNEKQAREKARVQIALLSKAIEEYKMDMGAYPGAAANTPVAGNISAELYQALFKEGYDYTNPSTPPSNWTKATKIYLPELDPRSSKQGWVDPVTSTTPPASVPILDPWGTPYKYRKGNNAQNPDFDLWSSGKDAQSDTSNPVMTSLRNKDDIRNF
jgi:prepilin-type N-terminal cleavage/methylation domain-containing protein